MRSHDYCHFEIALSTTDSVTVANVDDMRKDAARLADKAVKQYKIAKAAKERYDRINEPYRLAQAQATPEDERTPEEKAIIKFHQDVAFRARFAYDFEDDWNRYDEEEE